jgi:hypothetical protein
VYVRESVMRCSFYQTHAGAEIQRDCNMTDYELVQFGSRNIDCVWCLVAEALECELFS